MKKFKQSYQIILCFILAFFNISPSLNTPSLLTIHTAFAQKTKAKTKAKTKVTKPKVKQNQILNQSIDRQTFDQEINALIQQLESKKAKVSIYAVQANDLKPIFEYQPNQSLHPASNTKIITTGIALTLLGTDFHYETEFGVTAKIGKRPNHLYWLASGDSQINHETLGKIADEIKEKAQKMGIQEFQDLIIDPQKITLSPPPGFEDKADDDEAYRAPTGPVSVEFNKITVTIKVGAKDGDATEIEIFPKNSNVIIDNQSKTISKGKETLNIKSIKNPKNEKQTLLQISGNLPLKQKTVVVQKRSADALGYVFGVLHELLKSRGLLLRGEAKIGIYPAKGTVQTLVSYQSKPLTDYISVINQESNNLMAEQLLLSLAKSKRGVGEWAEGKALVKQFLEEQLHFSDFVYDNGSGLFGKTHFSAKQLVEFLAFMQKQPQFEAFNQSLAKPFFQGTLKNRLKDLPKNTLFAKTGTLNGVSSLSGYLDQMIFAIIINDAQHLNLKGLEDQIIRLFYYLNR